MTNWLLPCCSWDKEFSHFFNLPSIQTKSFLPAQHRAKKRDERTLCSFHTLALHKTSGLLKAQACSGQWSSNYLQLGPSDTQQNFPLVDLSLLCASKLPNRERIKLRLKLLSFTHAEHGHLLYFSNMRPVHGHSWVVNNSVLAQTSLGKERRKGGTLWRKEFRITYQVL